MRNLRTVRCCLHVHVCRKRQKRKGQIEMATIPVLSNQLECKEYVPQLSEKCLQQFVRGKLAHLICHESCWRWNPPCCWPLATGNKLWVLNELHHKHWQLHYTNITRYAHAWQLHYTSITQCAHASKKDFGIPCILILHLPSIAIFFCRHAIRPFMVHFHTD